MILKGGRGGDGSSSFARDNITPRGKADGGNGGDGGNVLIIADPSVNSLNLIKHEYRAADGANGHGNGCYGMRGSDTSFSVPIGTVIYKIECNGKKTYFNEFNDAWKQILIAKGGNGGKGNRALRSNNHQHEKGFPGEEVQIELDMNTIADIGLVGQPNAGKSSFLASISRSTPKIAPYPFTTLSPNIGILSFDSRNPVSIADVPGLIEGAHQNVGLGHEFLKHVRKSKKLILVLDVSAQSPIQDGRSVFNELELYQKGLSDKVFLILANKIDRLLEFENIINELQREFPKKIILPVSAKHKIGVDKIINFISKHI